MVAVGREALPLDLEDLLELAPDAMVVVDARGMILAVNRQTERLLGYGPEELVGRPVECLVPQRFRASHSRDRERYMAKPRVRPLDAGLDFYGLRRDGTEIPLTISLSPVHRGDECVVIAALRDMTELKEADRLKDEFLATVSHELRTPLTAISGFAETLLARGDVLGDEMKQNLLTQIVASAEEMTEMVEQLLDFSRLQAGKVTLNAEPVDLPTAMESCVRAAAGDLSGHPLQLDVTAGLETVVDRSALKRILVNLLTNAGRFSPQGAPIVIGARGDPGATVIFVRDQGVGIPPEEHERIFERFYQAGVVSEKRGTGIGLSIVRRYADLIGGSVTLDSAPGEGSCFSLTLPGPAKSG